MKSTPRFTNTYDRRIRGQETRRIGHSTSRQQFRQPIITVISAALTYRRKKLTKYKAYMNI